MTLTVRLFFNKGSNIYMKDSNRTTPRRDFSTTLAISLNTRCAIDLLQGRPVKHSPLLYFVYQHVSIFHHYFFGVFDHQVFKITLIDKHTNNSHKHTYLQFFSTFLIPIFNTQTHTLFLFLAFLIFSVSHLTLIICLFFYFCSFFSFHFSLFLHFFFLFP